MIRQGFFLGDRDWWLMPYYNVSTENDLSEVYEALLAAGCPDDKAQRACMVLSGWNHGYTYTNFDDHISIMCIGKSDSAEQFFDTFIHELKHVTEHISEFYGLEPREELSAYLQGEVGRLMFPAIAMAVCPKCNHEL